VAADRRSSASSGGAGAAGNHGGEGFGGGGDELNSSWPRKIGTSRPFKWGEGILDSRSSGDCRF
jgi:hypothetical protein